MPFVAFTHLVMMSAISVGATHSQIHGVAPLAIFSRLYLGCLLSLKLCVRAIEHAYFFAYAPFLPSHRLQRVWSLPPGCCALAASSYSPSSSFKRARSTRPVPRQRCALFSSRSLAALTASGSLPTRIASVPCLPLALQPSNHAQCTDTVQTCSRRHLLQDVVCRRPPPPAAPDTPPSRYQTESNEHGSSVNRHVCLPGAVYGRVAWNERHSGTVHCQLVTRHAYIVRPSTCTLLSTRSGRPLGH